MVAEHILEAIKTAADTADLGTEGGGGQVVGPGGRQAGASGTPEAA